MYLKGQSKTHVNNKWTSQSVYKPSAHGKDMDFQCCHIKAFSLRSVPRLIRSVASDEVGGGTGYRLFAVLKIGDYGIFFGGGAEKGFFGFKFIISVFVWMLKSWLLFAPPSTPCHYWCPDTNEWMNDVPLIIYVLSLKHPALHPGSSCIASLSPLRDDPKPFKMYSCSEHSSHAITRWLTVVKYF